MTFEDLAELSAACDDAVGAVFLGADSMSGSNSYELARVQAEVTRNLASDMRLVTMLEGSMETWIAYVDGSPLVHIAVSKTPGTYEGPMPILDMWEGRVVACFDRGRFGRFDRTMAVSRMIYGPVAVPVPSAR